MAGDYKGPGHKIVSGETPIEGLRVMTNDMEWGLVIEVADRDGHVTCGWYCEAWHTIKMDDGRIKSFNCDRLTTKAPLW